MYVVVCLCVCMRYNIIESTSMGCHFISSSNILRVLLLKTYLAGSQRKGFEIKRVYIYIQILNTYKNILCIQYHKINVKYVYIGRYVKDARTKYLCRRHKLK